jgi:cysteinyl-tRNA synthetase
MSKSLGNMFSIKDVLAKHSADAVRVFVLSSHYRSPLSFTWEGLAGAEKGAERLARAVNRENNSSAADSLVTANYRRQFIEAMDDDFNSAKATGILFDLARETNLAADSGKNVAEAVSLLKQLAGDVLGLRLNIPAQVSNLSVSQEEIEHLIQERYQFRQTKEYKKADEIRKKLDEMGILLEDGPKGTTWKQKK